VTLSSTGPRRRAQKAQRRVSARGLLPSLLVVVLAVVAVLLFRPADTVEPVAGVGSASGAPAGAPVSAPVRHGLLSCPSPAPSATSTRIAVGSAPLPGHGDRGQVGASVPGGPSARLPLGRGTLADVPQGVAGAEAVIEAKGELAAGLFGFRSDRGPHWSAAVPCGPPRASWWFTGAGASLDHGSTLLISNLDPGVAVVDVRVYGPDGEVPTVSARGIALAPGTRKVLDLRDLAPQVDDMTLSVRATRGRVAAAVQDRYATGPGPATGESWLPDQPRPMRVVRLAGLPAKAERRTLLVANPSELQAVVRVEVSGRSGSFTPTGLEAVQVAPGTVSAIDLSDIVRNEDVTVSLRSRVPVTATVRSTTAGDASYAAAVLPLSGPGALPVLAGADTAVVLGAREVAGEARAAAYDERGTEVGSVELVLHAGSTRTWAPPARAAYVVVTPVTGLLFGASVSSGHGPGVPVALPLVALPVRLRQPFVVPAFG
jgi:hypothetical protein